MSVGPRAGAAAAVLLAAALLCACLGGMPRDTVTRAIVTAPGAALNLPLHESRAHWLMRDLPRWCGAAEAQWGGGPDDRAAMTARAARFRDETAAARALDRLTPEYLSVAFQDQIAEGPYPIDYPEPLPGDEAKVNEYNVRLPLEIAADTQLQGQLTAVRTGKVVILTESIGVPSEELIPAFEAMVAAAAPAAKGC
ncbi:MAG: hypothetical protein AB7R89_18165 [Dehalococcoidia bacterium]